MRNVYRALCAFSFACFAVPAPAQTGDAFVLPPGTVRLRGTSEISVFSSRFGREGEPESLGAGLSGPLTSRTFAPLRPLESRLNAFFAANSSTAVVANEQSLLLGTLDVHAESSVQVIPLGVSVGVLPRLEIGVAVPVLREEQLLSRFGLSGGTLGENPNPVRNGELLAGIGSEWRELGASGLLPTDSSALGRELQRLVGTRLPGRSLDLPDSSATTAILNQLLTDQFGVAPLESEVRAWRVGDTELSARVRLLSTFGAAPLPADSAGLHYRAAVTVSGRFPTGVPSDSIRLLSYFPDMGLRGFSIGLDGDVFAGRRVWATVSLSYASTAAVEVVRRVVVPEQPLSSIDSAQTVRWTPGERIALRVAPRYRLTDALALGAEYSLSRLGASTFALANGSGADALTMPEGTAQALGLGMRYTTLGAHARGARLLPIEVVLSYRTTLSAPALRPDATSVVLQASLFHRAWGGGT